MAKALFKEVAGMLSMRDWVALTHTWADGKRGLNWARRSPPKPKPKPWPRRSAGSAEPSTS